MSLSGPTSEPVSRLELALTAVMALVPGPFKLVANRVLRELVYAIIEEGKGGRP